MQEEIVVMSVVRERRGVMQRRAPVEIDRMSRFWKSPCQVSKSSIKYLMEWCEEIVCSFTACQL